MKFQKTQKPKDCLPYARFQDRMLTTYWIDGRVYPNLRGAFEKKSWNNGSRDNKVSKLLSSLIAKKKKRAEKPKSQEMVRNDQVKRVHSRYLQTTIYSAQSWRSTSVPQHHRLQPTHPKRLTQVFHCVWTLHAHGLVTSTSRSPWQTSLLLPLKLGQVAIQPIYGGTRVKRCIVTMAAGAVIHL